MDPTRQTWRTAALVVTLAGLAALTGSVMPAVGAAAVSGWLVAVQLAAVRSVRSTAADATVQLDFDSDREAVGTPIAVTATVERPTRATGTALTVTYPTPPIAEPIPEADRRIELAPSETQGSTTFGLQSSVPGRIRLPEPTWRLVDASGSVTESFSHGPTPAVDIVETAGSDRQAVGGVESQPPGERGGQQSGRTTGIDRLRPYEATDPAARIDWNTTARLGEPYVREAATRRDQPTSLLVDHRQKLLAGSGDETMFDALGSVALGVVATAVDRGDPLGVVTVGDGGVTSTIEPTTSPDGYSEIRRRLQELDATSTDQPAGIEIDHPPPADRGVRSDDHAVGRLLETFGSASTTARSTAERRPLVEAVQCHQATVPSESTVIITDDTDRAELWAAVRVALQTPTDVVVYLTPRVRFDANHTVQRTRATDRYRQFERFRRRLDGVDSVTAREVTPGSEWSGRPADPGEPTAQPWSTNGQTSEQTKAQTSRPETATAAVSNGDSNE